jgi:hypothetical protein
MRAKLEQERRALYSEPK